MDHWPSCPAHRQIIDYPDQFRDLRRTMNLSLGWIERYHLRELSDSTQVRDSFDSLCESTAGVGQTSEKVIEGCSERPAPPQSPESRMFLHLSPRSSISEEPTINNVGSSLILLRGLFEVLVTVKRSSHLQWCQRTINAVRYMSPHTVINVTVVGSEDRAYREFRGKLVTVYTDEEGYSWAKSLASIEGASIETSLTETHPEYGVVTSLYDESQLLPGVPTLSPNKPHTDHKYNDQLVTKTENLHIHINDHELNQVYPEFRNVAIGAAILFFSVVGIALLDIVRRIISMRRAKKLKTGKYSRVNGM
ncbi:conserved hypothetical protein [Culex quinquefasciatus]|uniref:Uncharacterized protein n=1 Tax=Culex quinquefasciatus TaxID=7176 RepID=B0X6E9_CULQU|nr:conserved hypothetical protein [Culex quinquefasciatus]|eukprot:XP_001865221.1 conserved hypothetical protein [Culex quinquefasciatus]